jgi:hypothetical protein
MQTPTNVDDRLKEIAAAISLLEPDRDDPHVASELVSLECAASRLIEQQQTAVCP